MKTNNIAQIINNVFEKGYIDDHDNHRYMPKALLVHVRLNGTTVTTAEFDSSYFCLNPLYFEEEEAEVHLSTCSNGGTIDMRHVKSPEEAVANYNKMHSYGAEGCIYSQVSIIYREQWEARKAREAKYAAA